jgi:hypothetical protein
VRERERESTYINYINSPHIHRHRKRDRKRKKGEERKNGVPEMCRKEKGEH